MVAGLSPPAEGLEGAPQAVPQVEADHDHGDDVERRDVPMGGGEVGDDLVVRPGTAALGVDRAERQVQQVPDDEQQDDDAAVAHDVGGVPALTCLRAGGVAYGPRPPRPPGEGDRGPQVEDHGDGQHHLDDRQEGPVRDRGLADVRSQCA